MTCITSTGALLESGAGWLWVELFFGTRSRWCLVREVSYVQSGAAWLADRVVVCGIKILEVWWAPGGRKQGSCIFLVRLVELSNGQISMGISSWWVCTFCAGNYGLPAWLTGIWDEWAGWTQPSSWVWHVNLLYMHTESNLLWVMTLTGWAQADISASLGMDLYGSCMERENPGGFRLVVISHCISLLLQNCDLAKLASVEPVVILVWMWQEH